MGVLRITCGHPRLQTVTLGKELRYCICPELAVTLSVLCYKVMSRFIPRSAAVLCGGM